MVETLLTPVIEKLIEFLIQEAKSLKGVHKDVKSLKNELEVIEPLLRDAEAKSGRGELSDASKAWLRQLREEAEHIEDVVDVYTYYTEKICHDEDQLGFAGSLHKLSRRIKALKTRHGLASEIRHVKESLREIRERGVSYGLRPFEQGGSSGSGERNSSVDPRIGSLFVDDEELIGIESVSNELVRVLVEGPSEHTTVSLVGEGGIGKTTLAKKVYNDVVEKGCFDHHVWVTVSQLYEVDKILKILMARICASGGGGEIVAIEEVFDRLRSSLRGKRYVIFFDDVWETNFWSFVKHAFPSSSKNGSRIVLTTRKSAVVESFKSPSGEMIVKELKTWPEEQAWKLFCIKAFPVSYCPKELEQLSHEILSKCHGLPLALVSLAGLLSKKEKRRLEWKKVLDHLNYKVEENHELSSVTKILLLSYHDLPHHLKQCFLYFGVFPEDFSVEENRLCRIWIAEGFIKIREEKSHEQIAEEYLIELIDRNLVSFELLYGFQRHCKVHDLTREVILTKINDLGFCKILYRNKSSHIEKSRRLIIYNTTHNVSKGVCAFKVRSIVLFNTQEVSNSFVVGLFENCKLLKMVDFEASPLGNLPKEVGNLSQLKYLNLRGTKVKTIPKSIGKLRNLETLDLGNTLVRKLPVEINKLHKLRHLAAYDLDQEIKFSVKSFIGVRMHDGIRTLKELQNLGVVEAHSGRADFIKELQNLSRLKSLGVSKLSAKMSQALGESINEMKDLEQLILFSINEDDVLDLSCISSPPILLRYFKLTCRLQKLPIWVSELHNLQGLELDFSRLLCDPMKMLKGLSNLLYLRMHKAYTGEELRFEEGSFLKLKHLEMNYLEGLISVKIERGALPLLEELEFGPSPLMKEFPCDLRHSKNLKSLKVNDMPTEFVNALQPNGGSEFCKIKHISSVTFGYSTGKWLFRNSYLLGSSELLQYLKGQN